MKTLFSSEHIPDTHCIRQSSLENRTNRKHNYLNIRLTYTLEGTQYNNGHLTARREENLADCWSMTQQPQFCIGSLESS